MAPVRYIRFCVTLSHRVLLFPDRSRSLVIAEPERPVLPRVFPSLPSGLFREKAELLSPFFYKIPDQPQIFGIRLHLVQPKQSHFDDLMTRIAVQLSFFRPEYLIDIVHKARHGLKQPVFSRGLGIGNGGFQQMAGAVQFMIAGYIGSPLFQPVYGVIGADVAIRLLGLQNQIDQLIRPGFQFRIRMLS